MEQLLLFDAELFNLIVIIHYDGDDDDDGDDYNDKACRPKLAFPS